MLQKKHIIIIAIAACVLVGGFLLWREHKAREPIAIDALTASPLDFEDLLNPTNTASPTSATPAPVATPRITPTTKTTPLEIPVISAPPIPTPSPKPRVGSTTKTPNPDATARIPSEIGKITIKTSKSTKTYVVKKGVEEKILKKNIGWMESSALPGENGVCVLMGHRDLQLRILKDIQEGDRLILTDFNQVVTSYVVQSATIFETADDIIYPSGHGTQLCLVTCYPFYYKGRAPQKIVFYAEVIKQ